MSIQNVALLQSYWHAQYIIAVLVELPKMTSPLPSQQQCHPGRNLAAICFSS